jgi:hypothetical protein
MKKNEIYWLNLYKEGKIEINFETGEVFSHLSGKKHLLGKNQKKQGYVRATAGISRKDRNPILIHRFIWIIANGDIPEYIEVNHKNGIKNDNRLENLDLKTKSGNAIHSRRVLGNRGGIVKGEQVGTSKLKSWQVLEIRQRYKKGIVTLKFLAKEYGIHYATVWDIIVKRIWKEI